MSAYLHAQHFSVEEAQQILAEILPELNRMVELKHTLDEKGYDVFRHKYFGGLGPNGQKFFPQELEDIVEIAQMLDRRGIQLKAIETALIDFPHVRTNGEEVYLCYYAGEAAITTWHTIADGFAGRQLLETL